MIITQRAEVEGDDGGLQKHWVMLSWVLIVRIILDTVRIYCIHPLYSLCFPLGKKIQKIYIILSDVTLDILGKKRLKTLFFDFSELTLFRQIDIVKIPQEFKESLNLPFSKRSLNDPKLS